MGGFISRLATLVHFATGGSPIAQPDLETRRQQILEATLKRQANQEHRGIKDPQAFRQKQRRREKYEKNCNQTFSRNDASLKWSVG